MTPVSPQRNPFALFHRTGRNISKGMYDSSMTFFGRGYHNGSGARENTDGSLFDYYYSNKFAIHFPGGCSFSLESYGANYTFTYATPHGTVSSDIYTNSRYDAVGLMSDDIYTYDVDKGSPLRTVTVNALMFPVLRPFVATAEGAKKWCASFVPLDASSGTHYYPAPLVSIDSESSDSAIDEFNKRHDTMGEFWRIVDANANSCYIATTMNAGGRIIPETAWGKINEPRMFTVTPDEHHAIHSVTAYNTLTNQQIPLQESGMDLLTGAKSYMFTMPAANVRIIVEFRSIEIAIPVTVKYTSPRGKVFTTSFNLLYDDTEQREETAPPVEEQEGENQNE